MLRNMDFCFFQPAAVFGLSVLAQCWDDGAGQLIAFGHPEPRFSVDSPLGMPVNLAKARLSASRQIEFLT